MKAYLYILLILFGAGVQVSSSSPVRPIFGKATGTAKFSREYQVSFHSGILY
jgi:hypothetical protein